MKKSKQLKQAAGLCGIFAALVTAISLIGLAIRKKSLSQAILALVAAMGAAAGTGLLLADVFAPDTEGERLVQETAACDEELFDAEMAQVADRRMRHVLGGSRVGEVTNAPSHRPVILRDEEASEADFL
ncbi:MAG: hypothetical protein IJW51_03015 [Clostridia bacterium]|nr:hypothetical protein [Clostridia bacterium]